MFALLFFVIGITQTRAGDAFLDDRFECNKTCCGEDLIESEAVTAQVEESESSPSLSTCLVRNRVGHHPSSRAFLFTILMLLCLICALLDLYAFSGGYCCHCSNTVGKSKAVGSFLPMHFRWAHDRLILGEILNDRDMVERYRGRKEAIERKI